MTISVNSRAAGVGAGVKNVQFISEAKVIERKVLIIGTYDPAITTIVDEEPVQIFSAEDAGSKFGFGFMAHRLAVQAFVGSNGVKTYVQPQAEGVGAAAGAGDVDFVGSTGVVAGTLALYIAGIRVAVAITDSMTADEVATAVAAAITAEKELPVTCVVNGVTTSQVDITSKSKGTWGNDISIRLNQLSGEETPSGIALAITDMASGATDPDIGDALDGLGTGDDANELHFTDVVHGYGQATATLNAIRDYVGAGNVLIGLYDQLVARPFRVLTGDTASGSGGLTALIALGDGRKTDRANGVIAVPDSPNHPAEIAANAIGIMARINSNLAEQNYIDEILTGIIPGAKANRWTSDYDSRDSAVKSGVSPTKIKGSTVYLQNVLSFYHPDDVPVASNGFASMRNISITQNILANVKLNFEQEKWKGISIVDDVAKVSSVADRSKARDVETVKDDLVALIRDFESKAWIYQAAFSYERLAADDAVTIRSGTTGFDIILDVIYSGEGGILNTLIQFDTSISVLG